MVLAGSYCLNVISDCFDSFSRDLQRFSKVAPPKNLQSWVKYYGKSKSFGKEFWWNRFNAVERVRHLVTVSIDVTIPLLISWSSDSLCIPLCNPHPPHRPVLMPTLVLQTSKLDNDMYVWIHWNTRETWLQSKSLKIVIHMLNTRQWNVKLKR